MISATLKLTSEQNADSTLTLNYDPLFKHLARVDVNGEIFEVRNKTFALDSSTNPQPTTYITYELSSYGVPQ